jgi:hypothetical protein
MIKTNTIDRTTEVINPEVRVERIKLLTDNKSPKIMGLFCLLVI